MSFQHSAEWRERWRNSDFEFGICKLWVFGEHRETRQQY